MALVGEEVVGGIGAFVLSTCLSLIFGEIIPQSVCAKFGLTIGYHTSWIVRVLVFLFYPIGWPLAKLLDLLVGAEAFDGYSRKELTELIAFHARVSMLLFVDIVLIPHLQNGQLNNKPDGLMMEINY